MWHGVSPGQQAFKILFFLSQYFKAGSVMVHAQSHSSQRTIIGWLWQSLQWWPPHHCSVPPSSDLYWTSIGILPLLRYHQQIIIPIIAIANQHHALSTAAQPKPHHAPSFVQFYPCQYSNTLISRDAEVQFGSVQHPFCQNQNQNHLGRPVLLVWFWFGSGSNHKNHLSKDNLI